MGECFVVRSLLAGATALFWFVGLHVIRSYPDVGALLVQIGFIPFTLFVIDLIEG